MQVLGAYEETESTLHFILSCHSGLREIPLHENDEKTNDESSRCMMIQGGL